MIHLKIDHTDISVPEGTSVLEAARSAGLSIPSMCYKEGHENHPSCMMCVVKDQKTGNLFPSCAIKAVEGMELLNNDPDVYEARRDSLELLLSDHVGDCEAPCSLACPANMNIPLMNRHIASNNFPEALRVVKEEIALPYILGYICPAPCEKACRRKQIDNAVSVCLLKRFVAEEDEKSGINYLPVKEKINGKKIAIIGTGPAGLSAAYYLLQKGHSCILFDKNEQAGGALRYSIPESELPHEALDAEINRIRNFGAEFRLSKLIDKDVFEKEIKPAFDAIILATGDIAVDSHLLSLFSVSKTGISLKEGTFETSEKGVFACGSIVRAQKMAIRASAQGKDAAISAGQFLNGKTLQKTERKFNSRFDKLSEPEFAEYLKECAKNDRLAPARGLLAGFDRSEAMEEAARCMHCDCRKLDNCKLRNYSDEYKADRKKYSMGERKALVKYFEHELLVYEPEKCIRCGLCIDITVKNNELIGLTFMGRGFDVRMRVPFNSPISAGLTHTAVECVESCPTGALAFKKK